MVHHPLKVKTPPPYAGRMNWRRCFIRLSEVWSRILRPNHIKTIRTGPPAQAGFPSASSLAPNRAGQASYRRWPLEGTLRGGGFNWTLEEDTHLIKFTRQVFVALNRLPPLISPCVEPLGACLVFFVAPSGCFNKPVCVIFPLRHSKLRRLGCQKPERPDGAITTCGSGPLNE